MIPNEVFLSHSSDNEELATRLSDELSRHGVPNWYSRKNILGAQQWHDEIGKALKRCDWFAIVLSPGAVQSMWVKRELFYVLNQDRLAERIIPLLYEPCDFESLSFVLPSCQMVNFQGEFETGMQDLLRIWGVGYQANS